MEKLTISTILICLYCFPYVYFSMYLDFANGSILGYIFMIIMTSLLAFLGGKYSNSILILVGNSLSFIVSFYLIGEVEKEGWDGYFKPLAPNQLLLVVSLLNLILQYFAIRLAKKYKKK